MTAPRRAADDSLVIETSSAPRRGKQTGIFERLSWRVVAAPLAVTVAIGSVAVLTSIMDDTDQRQPAVGTSGHYTAGNDDLTPENSRSSVRTRSPLPSSTTSPAPSSTTSPAPSSTTSPSPSGSSSPSTSATPKTSATATPPKTSASASPSIDFTALGDPGSPMWTKASVNIRSGPSTDFEIISSRASGSKVFPTNRSYDGWQQVALDDQAGWIKASYLTEVEPKSASLTGSGSSQSSGISSDESSNHGAASGEAAICPAGKKIADGLTARTRNVLAVVCQQFPHVTSYGGSRSGGGYHSQGRAIDVMISGEPGWKIARWLRTNAADLGVIEVIYEQQIWTTQRSSEGWRAMSDRGSASANHYDHVHISVK